MGFHLRHNGPRLIRSSVDSRSEELSNLRWLGVAKRVLALDAIRHGIGRCPLFPAARQRGPRDRLSSRLDRTPVERGVSATTRANTPTAAASPRMFRHDCGKFPNPHRKTDLTDEFRPSCGRLHKIFWTSMGTSKRYRKNTAEYGPRRPGQAVMVCRFADGVFAR